MVDTTIPGISAEIVEPDVARPIGTAGRIAIVGIFEKGDYNTPYFFNNPRSAAQAMGSVASYSGSKIIEYVFEQDPDNNNYGATSIICVRAGATAKAQLQLLDGSSANVMLIKAKSGGLWGNGAAGGLKITVASGTLSGKKLTVSLNDVAVEIYDNSTNTQLYNKINSSSSYVTATATSTELARTLATISATSLAGGTETAAPTTSDITSALATILNEQFDILIYTDTPEDAYYASTETWLNNKLGVDKPAMAILPINTSKSTAQAITLVGGADSKLISYVFQSFTIGEDELTVAESAARYAGFAAGMAVQESPTNKIMNNIDALNKEYGFSATDDGYALVDTGVTMFQLKNRENRKYGVVSAVTASQEVDDSGRKKGTSELYAMRVLTFVLNYMNLEDWLGMTGITKTLNTIEGELNNRRNLLLKEDIAESIDIDVSADPDDNRLAYVDIKVKPYGILKHMTKRIKLEV